MPFCVSSFYPYQGLDKEVADITGTIFAAFQIEDQGSALRHLMMLTVTLLFTVF
jgi:hypothetical protein